MPELPEVKTIVKDLNKKINNKKIVDIFVNLPKLLKNCSVKEFKSTLNNQIIKEIRNKGKFIVFELTNDIYIVSHLRMEGKYHADEWENKKHDHVTFIFKDGTKLHYNDTRQFGTLHLFKEDPINFKPLNTLGSEPQDIDVEELYKRFQKKNIAIKTALLDQTIIVGLGNIYVNEVLWDVRISPFRSTSSISKKELNKILKSSFKIMDKATKLGGSSISTYASLDNKQGSYQNLLKVHTKENEECPRCKELIKKGKVNGRGTYYCSTCQK